MKIEYKKFLPKSKHIKQFSSLRFCPEFAAKFCCVQTDGHGILKLQHLNKSDDGTKLQTAILFHFISIAN